MSYLTKNPISGLEIIISRDNEKLLPKLFDRKLDDQTFRAIKKNKTLIIKEKSNHSIKSWVPAS